MRLSMLVFCFLGAATVAHQPPAESLKDHWLVELIGTDGKYNRVGWYNTHDSCESDIQNVLNEQHGLNGHCIFWDSKKGDFRGSQDPIWNSRPNH